MPQSCRGVVHGCGWFVVVDLYVEHAVLNLGGGRAYAGCDVKVLMRAAHQTRAA